jgi:hypothetical protein
MKEIGDGIYWQTLLQSFYVTGPTAISLQVLLHNYHIKIIQIKAAGVN